MSNLYAVFDKYNMSCNNTINKMHAKRTHSFFSCTRMLSGSSVRTIAEQVDVAKVSITICTEI